MTPACECAFRDGAAFDHDVNDNRCARCGTDLYSGCPECYVRECAALRQRVAELEGERDRLLASYDRSVASFAQLHTSALGLQRELEQARVRVAALEKAARGVRSSLSHLGRWSAESNAWVCVDDCPACQLIAALAPQAPEATTAKFPPGVKDLSKVKIRIERDADGEPQAYVDDEKCPRCHGTGMQTEVFGGAKVPCRHCDAAPEATTAKEPNE